MYELPCDYVGMARLTLIELTADAHSKLADWAKAHGTPQQVVKRCRLVLLMAAGVAAARAAKIVGTNRHQPAPTGTNRHQPAPTGTNRHQPAHCRTVA
jgi:hypothetical protein